MTHPIQITLELEDVDVILEALSEPAHWYSETVDRERILTEIHAQTYL